MEVALRYTLLFYLFTLYNTVYTIQTALHCLNSSHIYCYGVRALYAWPYEQREGVDG